MMLSRPQIIGLYSMAMELPVDSTFELTPPNNKGDVVVLAKADSIEMQTTAVLKKQGGRETVAPGKTIPHEAYDAANTLS